MLLLGARVGGGAAAMIYLPSTYRVDGEVYGNDPNRPPERYNLLVNRMLITISGSQDVLMFDKLAPSSIDGMDGRAVGGLNYVLDSRLNAEGGEARTNRVINLADFTSGAGQQRLDIRFAVRICLDTSNERAVAVSNTPLDFIIASGFGTPDLNIFTQGRNTTNAHTHIQNTEHRRC